VKFPYCVPIIYRVSFRTDNVTWRMSPYKTIQWAFNICLLPSLSSLISIVHYLTLSLPHPSVLICHHATTWCLKHHVCHFLLLNGVSLPWTLLVRHSQTSSLPILCLTLYQQQTLCPPLWSQMRIPRCKEQSPLWEWNRTLLLTLKLVNTQSIYDMNMEYQQQQEQL
jgi:hypothetical protein